MKKILHLKDHPILEITKNYKGELFELGEQLKDILKDKYQAANNEKWFEACLYRERERELTMKIESLVMDLNIEIPRR